MTSFSQLLKTSLVAIALWGSCETLFAENRSVKEGASSTASAAGFDLNNETETQFIFLDDPNGSVDWVKAQVKILDSKVSPEAWVRAHWFLSQSDELETPVPASVLNLAFEKKMFIEWTGFRIGEINLVEQEGNIDQAKTLYKSLIEEVRAFQDGQSLAVALAAQAEFLIEYGGLNESLGLIKEANELYLKEEKPSLFVFSMVKSAFAVALDYSGKKEAAIDVHVEMEKKFLENNIRNARSINLYNLAHTYITDADKPDPKALPYLNISLELGRDLKSDERTAVTHYGLSIYYNGAGAYENAIKHAREAIRLYTKLGKDNWVGYTRLRLVEALNNAKDHNAALQMLALLWPDLEKEDHYRVQLKAEQLYLAHRGLGQHIKALEQLEVFNEAFKAGAKEREQEEYNKASAKIGLQFEEERNRNLEEKGQALAHQNRLQGEQIQLLNKFRVVSIIAVVLMLMTLIALVIVKRQASTIRSSRIKMREILENIHEGILMIDHKFHVMDGYSPYLPKILDREGQNLVGIRLVDLLFDGKSSSDEQAIKISETLHTCIDGKELSWELNHSHLPVEITRNGKAIALHWQAHYDRLGTITGFLLSLRDITSQRAMESEMRKEKMRVDLIQKKLEEILAQDIGFIHRFLMNVKKESEKVSNSLFLTPDIADAFRYLHSWKGSARTLGLNQLAHVIHQMESLLNLDDPFAPAGDQAKNQWQDFVQMLSEYQNLLVQIMPQRHHEETPKNLYGFAKYYAQDMQNRLNAIGVPCRGLEISDAIQLWCPEKLAVVHDILLHAIGNSIDHGFMWPKSRGEAVRDALIKVSTQQVGNRILLQVEDNGAGIDWAGLRAKAQREGRTAHSEHDLSLLLFTPGFTTAESMHQTSGRGMGLSAVHSLCQNLGGMVSVTNSARGGTLLCLEFPLENLVPLDDSLLQRSYLKSS